MSTPKTVGSVTRRRNVVLGVVLALFILALVALAILNVSPETAGGHESLFSK